MTRIDKSTFYQPFSMTLVPMQDTMRADFELPTEARSKLLDMLCWSGVESPEWWRDVLVGEGDPLYRELEAI